MMDVWFEKKRKISNKHWYIIVFAVAGLVCIYLFQKKIHHYFSCVGLTGYSLFFVERSLRFIINDFLMILLIYGIFEKKKYVLFAFYVQLVGITIILLPYMIIKSYTEYNGPLVSFLHRLIINPLLLLLLIPAFFYQEKYENQKNEENQQ